MLPSSASVDRPCDLLLFLYAPAARPQVAGRWVQEMYMCLQPIVLTDCYVSTPLCKRRRNTFNAGLFNGVPIISIGSVEQEEDVCKVARQHRSISLAGMKRLCNIYATCTSCIYWCCLRHPCTKLQLVLCLNKNECESSTGFVLDSHSLICLRGRLRCARLAPGTYIANLPRGGRFFMHVPGPFN